MPERARWWLAVLLLFAVHGCSTLEAPTARDLELVRGAMPEVAAAASTTAEVRVRSERMTGTFLGVLASERSGRVRLQLFPDVGGKILDLYAGPDRIAGSIPQASSKVDGRTGSGNLPRSLLTFFAITLLEHHTPVTDDRVLGVRRGCEGGDLIVAVAPRVPGSEVELVITRDGRLRERRLAYRNVGWREEPGEPVRVSGPGFELTAQVTETSILDAEGRERAFADLP